jgi:hypothetical protein
MKRHHHGVKARKLKSRGGKGIFTSFFTRRNAVPINKLSPRVASPVDSYVEFSPIDHQSKLQSMGGDWRGYGGIGIGMTTPSPSPSKLSPLKLQSPKRLQSSLSSLSPLLRKAQQPRSFPKDKAQLTPNVKRRLLDEPIARANRTTAVLNEAVRLIPWNSAKNYEVNNRMNTILDVLNGDELYINPTKNVIQGEPLDVKNIRLLYDFMSQDSSVMNKPAGKLLCQRYHEFVKREPGRVC